MKTLKEISSQFAVSKPVFVAELENDGASVNFMVNSIPMHDSDKLEDPVAKIIARRFSQSFDPDKRQFVQTTHLSGVHCDILDSISSFYEEHSSLKNPTQSRLYKWLRSMDNQDRHAASEGFIALYRYTEANGGQFHCDHDVVTNVLAILEMMREKYEVKQQNSN